MSGFFDICGTHIPISSIKDFRTIDVEFIFRPVYREIKKSMFSSKRFEFVSMQPYAAIIGQQGHKSALGEYKARDFKEALGKDITGAVIYTIADKLKLKAFKHQKYQCLNLAGLAFTTYLDDIPVMITWDDGRIAEVYKEDSLYPALGECATPGIQYVSALLIRANETFCFYGNGIQVSDALFEYERLKQRLDEYNLERKPSKKLREQQRTIFPKFPKFRASANKNTIDESDLNSRAEENSAK